jgi:CRP-like cAMP-binding protein
MPNALTRRLEEFTPLTDQDRDELAYLTSRAARSFRAGQDLIREGETPRAIFLIVEGWACHYRALDSGRRQIVDFALPGDLCDLNIFILDRVDHSVGALTTVTIAEIGQGDFRRVVASNPNITTALWWQELVSKSIHREWIVNVGSRNAEERLSHLFCEIFLRLESVGLTDGFSCDFPLTQVDLADATGLTSVHVNRTLKVLRGKGLISLERRRLTIPDMAALQASGQFSPDYLHHARLSRHTDARRAN